MNPLTLTLTTLALILLTDVAIRYAYIHNLIRQLRNRTEQRLRTTIVGDGAKPLTISLLGDSVLYGIGSEYPLPGINDVVERLATEGHKVTVNNYAITGHRIDEVTALQADQVKDSDLVYIYIGGNDYFRFTPVATFAKSAERLLSKLQGKRVIWCTLGDPRYLWPLPLWQRGFYYLFARGYMRRVEQIIKSHPQEKWYTIDFLNESHRRIKAQKLSGRILLSDGFHLSHRGHEFWAALVADGYAELKRNGADLP